MMAGIRNIDIALRIHSESGERTKLRGCRRPAVSNAIFFSASRKRSDASVRHFPDAAISRGDVDVACSVHRDGGGSTEWAPYRESAARTPAFSVACNGTNHADRSSLRNPIRSDSVKISRCVHSDAFVAEACGYGCDLAVWSDLANAGDVLKLRDCLVNLLQDHAECLSGRDSRASISAVAFRSVSSHRVHHPTGRDPSNPPIDLVANVDIAFGVDDNSIRRV